MWWLIDLLAFIIPVSLITDNAVTAAFAITFNQFLLLGIIPGTNIQITFTWLIVGSWCAFFVWLYAKAFPRLFDSMFKHRLPKGINPIDLQSL